METNYHLSKQTAAQKQTLERERERVAHTHTHTHIIVNSHIQPHFSTPGDTHIKYRWKYRNTP